MLHTKYSSKSLLFLCFLIGSPLFGAQATIAYLKGGAYIEKGFEVRSARVGSKLKGGEILKVMQDSQATVRFNSGVLVKISETSRFEIQKSEEKSMTSGILLWAGSLWCSIRGSLKGESFEITTPTATAGVRGTEFEVAYNSSSEETEIIVSEGEVSVGNLQGKRMRLRKGEILRMARKRARRVIDEMRILNRRLRADSIPDERGEKAAKIARERARRLQGRIQNLRSRIKNKKPLQRLNEIEKKVDPNQVREKVRDRLKDRRKDRRKELKDRLKEKGKEASEKTSKRRKQVKENERGIRSKIQERRLRENDQ